GGQLADGRGSRLPRGATSSRPSRRPSSPCRAPARGTEAPTRLPTDGSRRSRVRRRSWRAPRSPGARAPRTSRTVTTLRRLPPFCEKPPNHRLGRVVLALADVLVADDPLAIQEDRRGPGPNAPALPDRVLVVLYHRVPDPQRLPATSGAGAPRREAWPVDDVKANPAAARRPTTTNDARQDTATASSPSSCRPASSYRPSSWPFRPSSCRPTSCRLSSRLFSS